MLERLLRKYFTHKEIGWAEIGEKFTRYAIFRCRWFNIYLHQLYAPKWHPDCHDHPWGFVALLLWRGYLERVHVPTPIDIFPVLRTSDGVRANHLTADRRRRVGSILWRPAEFSHNVITPYGESWSIIITGPKSRDWGFKPCDRPTMPTVPYEDYIHLNEMPERMAELQYPPQ